MCLLYRTAGFFQTSVLETHMAVAISVYTNSNHDRRCEQSSKALLFRRGGCRRAFTAHNVEALLGLAPIFTRPGKDSNFSQWTGRRARGGDGGGGQHPRVGDVLLSLGYHQLIPSGEREFTGIKRICRVKMAAERVVCLCCMCLLANRRLSLIFWRCVISGFIPN